MQTNGRDYAEAAVLPAASAAVALHTTTHTNNSNTPVPDVYRAICQVAKAISRDGIAKGARNQQQGYSFRGIDDIYNALSAPLAEADLCILPRMLSRSQEERTTAKGGVLFYVVVQSDFDFVSARDGSTHVVTTFGEAMDSADKATNKAMSAAYKYACLQVFCIPTEGMNDADATTPQPTSKHTAAQQAVVKAKLAAMPRAQPAVQLAEQIPEPEGRYTYDEEVPISAEERAHLEQELAAVAECRKAFEQLKARYQAIGAEKTYHAQLGLHGITKEITIEALAAARDCYRAMVSDVSKREARAK